MKKEIKKMSAREMAQQPATQEDIRGLKVFMEEMGSHWNLVAEQYGDISEKIDSVGAKLESMDRRFDRIEQRLNNIERSLEAHGEMIAKMAVELNSVKGEIQLIKPRLQKKADIEAFEYLERRVLALEKASR